MLDQIEKVSVVGLGYIGLPTAATLASTGVQVIGVDVCERVVEAVNAAKTHIVEPGLQEVLEDVVGKKLLVARTRPEPADAFLIAVPTPFLADGSEIPQPNISYVLSAARAIAPVLVPGNIVVLESTSPVGTTQEMAKLIESLRPDLAGRIEFCYSPERVIPGATMRELRSNSRVVGGMTPQAAERAAAIYARFVEGEITKTDCKTAEMVKLVENSFRDVNIAFANELSMICDRSEVNVFEVIELANRHPRVNILRPGAGVGGHCIAVDPWFIVSAHSDIACLIHTARLVNDEKPRFVIEKVEEAAALREGPIVCLGATFKADVDDFRESPALEIVRELSAHFGERVVCVDPFAEALDARTRAEINMIESIERLGQDPGVLVALVAHRQFASIVKPRYGAVDACGLWER